MSEKKKQDVAEQITDICQEFVALFTDFFFVLLVPLKEAGYQAVCSLPEVVDRGLGLN